MKLSTVFLNEPDVLHTESHVILMGVKDRLFNDKGLQWSALTSNPEVLKALNHDEGVILLTPSPFNAMYGLLTFTGRDEAALHKAVSAFLIPEFTQMASGTQALIDTLPVRVRAKSSGDEYHVTLKQLGYDTQSVSGLGRNQLSYTLTLPNDRIPEHTTIKTHITSPSFSLKDHAQVTLMINGLKQSSVRLTQEHSSWTVQIQSSAMKPGVNTLVYVFDLHLAHELCSRENYDELWATVHAETEFNTFFSNDYPQATLNQLPVPFSSEVTVIVPDELSQEDLDNLTHLFFKWGQLIQSNPFPINFLTSSEAKEPYIRTQNLILYGTAENNPWVTFAEEYMPVQLKGGSRVFKTAQTQLRLQSGDGSTGLLELSRSPWSEDHSVLLITGDNQAGLSRAVKAFIHDGSRMALKGNSALINADNSVESLNSDLLHYFSLKKNFLKQSTAFAKNTLHYVENNPQVFIYVLVFVVPLIIFMRRSK
jgi:hypothetical protein